MIGRSDEPTSRRSDFAYGSARGASIPVGVDTRRLVIQTTETAASGAFRGDVHCLFYGNHSDESGTTPIGIRVDRSWSASQWADPANRYLDLPAGAVEMWPVPNPRTYDRYDLECQSSVNSDGPQVVRLLWRVTPLASVGATVTLTEDVSKRFGATYIETYDNTPVRTVAEGDRLRISGAVKSWPANADNSPGNYLVAAISGPSSYDSLPIDSVTPDGSSLSLTVPAALAVPGRPGDTSLQLSTDFSTITGPTTTHITREWIAPAVIGDSTAAPTTTKVALSARYAVSIRRVSTTARVSISDGGGAVASGTVTFTVDGRQIGGPVAVDARGVAKLTLPLLPRGPHRIVASYSVADGLQQSQSAPALLRVLL